MAYFGITATEAGSGRGRGDLEAGLAEACARPTRAPSWCWCTATSSIPAGRDADPHRSLFAFRPAGDSGGSAAGPRGSASPTTPARPVSASASPGRRARRICRACSGRAHRLRRGLRPRRRLGHSSPSSSGSCSGWRPAGRSTSRAFARRAGGAGGAAASRGGAGTGDPARRGRARRPRARVHRRGARPRRRRSTTSRRGRTTSTTGLRVASCRGAAGASGRSASASAPGSAWIDLQLDRGDVTAWINAQGIRLTPPRAGSATGASTPGRARSPLPGDPAPAPGLGRRNLCAPSPASRAQELRWSRLLRGVGPWSPDGGRIAFE